MRKQFLVQSMLVVIILITAFFSCNSSNQKTETGTSITNDSLVKRGAYLVKIMGCNDCHSPKNMGPNGPEVDLDKLLSGAPSNRPIPPFDTNVIKKGIILFSGDLTTTAGPWGISFAANISADSTTGIGKWTEEQFARAITQGKYNGDVNGRMILPPMPWQDFSSLYDEDLKAIFAYLKSTKPVENKVHEPIAFDQIK